MEATIEFMQDSDPNAIVLARFTNGVIKDDKKMRFALLEEKAATGAGFNLQKARRKRKQLVAETDMMTYVGKNYSIHSAGHDQVKYLVGIYDQKSEKVKLYPCENFMLSPYFPDREVKPEEKEEKKSRFDQIDALTTAFGHKKKKSAMESRQKYQLKGASLETSMMSAAQTASVQSPNLETSNVVVTPQGSVNLPPCHEDAKSAREAYRFEDFLTEEELETLKTPAQAFVESNISILTEWKEAKKYPSYVLTQLSTLPVEAAKRQKKCCIIVYLSYLMGLFRLNYKQLRSKQFLPEEVPRTIHQKISENFVVHGPSANANRTERFMPTWMKDKVLAYILALCLMLDNFSLEFSGLLTDLAVGENRLIKILRALGCKIDTNKVPIDQSNEMAVRIATLPIPIKFPEQKPMRSKRK